MNMNSKEPYELDLFPDICTNMILTSSPYISSKYRQLIYFEGVITDWELKIWYIWSAKSFV